MERQQQVKHMIRTIIRCIPNAETSKVNVTFKIKFNVLALRQRQSSHWSNST